MRLRRESLNLRVAELEVQLSGKALGLIHSTTKREPILLHFNPVWWHTIKEAEAKGLRVQVSLENIAGPCLKKNFFALLGFELGTKQPV